MKIISDFDDVLFNNKKFKEVIFEKISQLGVSPTMVKEEYKKYRAGGKPFSLKKFLFQFTGNEGGANKLYETIMVHCENLRQNKVFELICSIGEENVYILTHGDETFQKDKIHRSFGTVFPNVYIVENSKREDITRICTMFPEEDIIFVDDKIEFFLDINMEQCPNLKKVLFDDHGFEVLKAEIDTHRTNELKK